MLFEVAVCWIGFELLKMFKELETFYKPVKMF